MPETDDPETVDTDTLEPVPADPGTLIPEGYRLMPGQGRHCEEIGPFCSKKLPDGSFTYAFVSQPRHANSGRVVHGGLLYTFADQFMGLSAGMAARQMTTTVSLKAEYLAPAPIGALIEGRCRITRLSRSMVFLRGEIFHRRRTLMTADGIWKLLEDRSGRTAGTKG